MGKKIIFDQFITPIGLQIALVDKKISIHILYGLPEKKLPLLVKKAWQFLQKLKKWFDYGFLKGEMTLLMNNYQFLEFWKLGRRVLKLEIF